MVDELTKNSNVVEAVDLPQGVSGTVISDA